MKLIYLRFAGLAFFVTLLLLPTRMLAQEANILIVVGPSNHPPGSHEVAAGGLLMKHCLENTANIAGVKVALVGEWPANQKLLDSAATVVFIGDTFPAARFPGSPKVMQRLGTMMDRGCGIDCIHYATGLRAEDVAEDGEHPLLHWLGGYFATRCKHHQSIARIYPSATVSPAAAKRPVWNGCREFTLNDEPYINNYFGKDCNKPAANVTVLATSMLPPDSPKKEAVSWCVERADKGRGFVIVMPHLYRNWKNEDLRRYTLNGIVWSAKLDVPKEGVETMTPDLAAFTPASVEPRGPILPPPKK